MFLSSPVAFCTGGVLLCPHIHHHPKTQARHATLHTQAKEQPAHREAKPIYPSWQAETHERSTQDPQEEEGPAAGKTSSMRKTEGSHGLTQKITASQTNLNQRHPSSKPGPSQQILDQHRPRRRDDLTTGEGAAVRREGRERKVERERKGGRCTSSSKGKR